MCLCPVRHKVLHELALFAGAGGGLLATQHLLGFRTICYVENANYPVKVLKARIQNGGFSRCKDCCIAHAKTYLDN